MKALSWKQPFASLMLHGKIETRTWSTNYRGLVLICVSKKPYSLKEVLDICGDYQHMRIVDTLGYEISQFNDVCGYAIGVGNLVDCRRMTPEDEDDCFVKYNPSAIIEIHENYREVHYPLWCHIYENVKEIEPFPFKGKQGWSTVDESIISKIKYLHDIENIKKMIS